jgi:hypothetical protein
MSQRQKQRTNENRARRLGTGEGIARQGRRGGGRSSGGVPAWAWVVGGAILLAAVGIVAALVLTRGNSSASGPDTSAQVVTDRETTAKIDWVSQGTWQPNYTNLGAALAPLGLTNVGSMANGYVTHYHAHITIYVPDNGKLRKVPIPADMGIEVQGQTATVLASVHTHDTSGVIHMESDKKNFKANLFQIMSVWGVRFNSSCIGGYCGGVHMWVNGKPNTQFGSYTLQEHDQVTLVAGPLPAGFKPQSSYKFAAGL